jgi:RNA polymerase sigma factor (sigma-70 family)
MGEESLGDTSGEEDAGLPSPDPRPSQIAVAREQWFKLLENEPPRHQRMIQMRYEGATAREIAARLGVHEGTVRRVLRRILREAN